MLVFDEEVEVICEKLQRLKKKINNIPLVILAFDFLRSKSKGEKGYFAIDRNELKIFNT